MNKLLSLFCFLMIFAATIGCGPAKGTAELNPEQKLDPIAPEAQIIDHG